MPIVDTTLQQSWLDTANQWSQAQTLGLGAVTSGPIVSGATPNYNEIIVDPNGRIGNYTTLAAAFAYVAATATAASPWTIRLLPGIYTQTAVLTPPSYCTLVGAGRDATIIQRTTALANSVTVGGVGRDPIIGSGSSVTNFRIENLTINHAGAWASGKETTGLALQDPLYFRAGNVRLQGTTWSFAMGRTALASPQAESTNTYFDNCIFTVDNTGTATSNDNIHLTNADLYLTGCQLLFTGTSTNSSDVIRVSGGRLFLKATDIIHRMTSTPTQSCCCIVINGSTVDAEIRIQGGRLLTDLSGGDFNGSGSDLSVIDFRNTVSGGDLNFYAEGTEFEYRTGAITAARSVTGFHCGQTFSNATKGNFFLAGCSIRDLGGSGGTNRADVVIDAASSHIIKQFLWTGTRVGSWLFRLSSPPTITYANYGATDGAMVRQTGSATFATAATVAVTFGTAYPTGVVDYAVSLEPSINETFWVTTKANTGFTLNSSNAASTATVRWTVTR